MRVAVVGCGLIGARRAEQASNGKRTELAVVVDSNIAVARSVAGLYGAGATTEWHAVVADPSIEALCVATPNAYLAEIAVAALSAGKHVLVEKPMGRNLAEARVLAAAASQARRILKIGFNHRYHPALQRARERFDGGVIGEIINMRARYGHGGRPGYEREWRGSPELAGGGELTDQGVHIADLLHWFGGVPIEAFAFVQTAVWPIAPLEDNAFGLFRFPGGAVASFHTSWTQWKNLFCFEIFGTRGSLVVEGLGGSYGLERLTCAQRKPEGGVPDFETEQFEGPDFSWELEWDDFIAAITDGSAYYGNPGDGLVAMRMLDALYVSARERRAVGISR